MRVVIVPPVPALLPEYASRTDPVPALRAAALKAVSDLGDSVRVLADDSLGTRVGESLLGRRSDPAGVDLLVMANGSASRSEKAPGHLDERAADFDAHLGALLAAGDVAGLSRLDVALGAALLASGLTTLTTLDRLGLDVELATVDHEDDPYGVMYWVVRWKCAS